MKCNACKAGINTFNVTPEGFLIPCCTFHLILGKLKEQSLKDIISISNNLKWWLGLTLEKYEECGKYDYCNYCNICPGLNYAEHGTPLKAAENCCFLAKIRKDLVTKIKGDI